MTRLVADSGCSMTGGPMPTGSRAPASCSRSCTSWRACRMSVPRLKMSTIEDIAITVLDRIDVDPGRAFERLLHGNR